MKQPFHSIPRIAKTRISEALPEGSSVLKYLSSRFDYMDMAGWSAQLAAGNLLLNGDVLTADAPLATGDEIEFVTRNLDEPDVDWNIEILADTPQYLAIAKPGSLPCHPAGSYFNHTVWAWCKQTRGFTPHFCGRLDRETSGVLFIAKDSKFADKVTKADAIKEYAVLVHGEFPEYLDARGYLAVDESSAIRKKRRFFLQEQEHEKGEFAHTEFHRQSFANGISLVKAVLHTGRTHQIRASLNSLGYPVVGDKLYGLDEEYYLKFIRGTLTDEDAGRLMLSNQALHCRRLVIPSLDIDVTAPLPTEWQAVINAAT